MSADIIVAMSGLAASAVGAVVAALSKYRQLQKHVEERQRVEQAARLQLTEIGLSLAGLGLTFKVPSRESADTGVSERLLRDVEQGIVDDVATKDHMSRDEVSQEVESRMKGVRDRIEAIEKRFPSDATIDKIASVNDALFAQRIEQLTERIAKLEEKALTKWDVALTVSLMVGGVFAVVAATYAALKAFGQVQ